MSERRMNDRRDDVDEDDRRKIPRFSNSELNRSLIQIKTWINVLYATSIIIAVFELGLAISKGLENLTQGAFFGMVFIILAILLWRSVFTLKLFLENHSVNNLHRVHEQLATLFAYVAVITIIFYGASLFLRF